ncbi:hypothetical protein [Selenomonas ruminis]|uniref:Uncharacterized protein n=1 Tax=Selenomonas ruminis TaxID=2593411 RepID=A0A5D6W3R9_9FIRM|nr:hypothetical protein [Selenomonas sp. mPRGC5]TYZ22953.1 hypothetical protein FZ040_06970 [Selenomonas sp. mPRGC5]
MTKEKYALLDTDFISKTHRIRKDNQNKMIDRIMEMPGYRFYCHEQIRIELLRHNSGNSPEWLEAKISDGYVRCMSDEEIIAELHKIYSDSAEAMYASMLKNGCEAYKSGYFEENFIRLKALDYLSISQESFLQELKADCDGIGEGKNLGELKSYVLLQVLSIRLGKQIYVFCSDDKNARAGIVSLGSARCISVLSAFMRLYQDGVLLRADAEPYIQAYLSECKKHNQLTFRVHDASKQMQMCKVPCEQVIEEMYAGKLELLQNGNLRYKQ